MERIGGWLFRHRTSIPLPIVFAILLIPADEASNTPVPFGVALALAGEALRLWAVHHIGVISRTRSDRLGPLVDAGPFGYVRNPLYLGNIAIWAGFALAARLVWLAPVAATLLALEYHAIVRWEERLLASRLGDRYREYVTRVPRWIPAVHSPQSTVDMPTVNPQPSTVDSRLPTFSWPETLFSERGTLAAMAAGVLLLWLKARS